MRRSINKSVLVTSWPPSKDYGKFNRSRFKAWLHYIIITNKIQVSQLTNRNELFHICHDTYSAIMNLTRDIKPETVRKLARILSKHIPNRTFESIWREATFNTKPYSKES